MIGEISAVTYSIEEAAKLLGIGRKACYEAAKTGEVPTVRIGKRLLVPKIALEKLLSGGA
jgi:excisionase family DNA binding protein